MYSEDIGSLYPDVADQLAMDSEPMTDCLDGIMEKGAKMLSKEVEK